ncbi:MAG: hypothetical protein ACNA7W_13515, partial [Pseudomonadales bacterium]
MLSITVSWVAFVEPAIVKPIANLRPNSFSFQINTLKQTRRPKTQQHPLHSGEFHQPAAIGCEAAWMFSQWTLSGMQPRERQHERTRLRKCR